MEGFGFARVISCNVGRPREATMGERRVLTGIFKRPVAGRVVLTKWNLAGDQQADLRVHGGVNKAVYAYPSEHYSYWASALQDLPLPWGMFGENLTTSGLDEESVYIGDRFQIGSAVLQVTQPRAPCYKLALKFGRPDIVERFWNSGRAGFYLSVIEEGELGAGDTVVRVSRGAEEVSVAEVLRLRRGSNPDPAALERALRSPLPAGWKAELAARWKASLPGSGPE